MQLKLVTLSGLKFDEEVYSVSIPTVDGEISVFPSHEPLVTVAAPGVITVRRTKDTKDEDFLMISGGVVKIDQTGVRILVDEADHGDEIVEAEAQAALERARQAHDEAGTQIEREKAKQLMDRHMVRLKVADLQRRKRRG